MRTLTMTSMLMLLGLLFYTLSANAQTLDNKDNRTLGIVSPRTSSDVHNSVATGADVRLLLTESLQILQDSSRAMNIGMAHQQQLSRVAQDLQSYSDDQLAWMAQNLPALPIWQQQLGLLRQQLDLIEQTQTQAAPESVGTREIEFPDPETTISECANVSATEAVTLLGTVFTVREILTALTWPCLETVLGENDATACTAVNLIKALAVATYQGSEACLLEQRDAVLEALLETQENVADHLSTYVDATTSSRASQDSLDDVQDDITTALSDVDELDTTVVDDFISIEIDLDDAFTDLDSIASDVVSLNAVLNDIQFRAQENQAQIELADDSAADAQETADEIRTDTQSIISALSTFQTDFNSISNDTDTSLDNQERAALEAALADSSLNIIRYQIPATAGGALESSREIVTQAIATYAALGAKVGNAQSLFTQGDVAYNQQNFLTAYDFYRQAYQNLTSTAQGVLR